MFLRPAGFAPLWEGEMWPGIQQDSKVPVGKAVDPKLISGGDVFSTLNVKRHNFSFPLPNSDP